MCVVRTEEPNAGWVTAFEVSDLRIEGDWAYLMGVITSDTRVPKNVGQWAYLVVHDAPAVGDVDMVSHMWAADTPVGKKEFAPSSMRAGKWKRKAT